MKRIPTGIKGLDEMLGGGFPKERVVIVYGGSGTGKTIFSLQFLASAAERGAHGFT
jgi:circadian clock protein KaiC